MIRKLAVANLSLLLLLLATAVVNAWSHGSLAQSYLSLIGGTMSGTINWLFPNSQAGGFVTMLSAATSNSSTYGGWTEGGDANNYDMGQPVNNIVSLGWNLSGSTNYASNQPQGRLGFEQNYYNNYEFHLGAFQDGVNAGEFRVIDEYFNWSTDVAQVLVSADTFNWYDTSHNNSYMTIAVKGSTTGAGALLRLNGNTQLYPTVNNQVVVNQTNAAGNGVVDWPYINGANAYYFPSTVQFNASALPTSCSGLAAGTLWNNSNALSLCP